MFPMLSLKIIYTTIEPVSLIELDEGDSVKAYWYWLYLTQYFNKWWPQKRIINWMVWKQIWKDTVYKFRVSIKKPTAFRQLLLNIM